MEAGAPISLRIDQTLTQDTTGTMTYLQFEAIGVPRVKTELSVSYVDHNTLQQGFRNPDDHQFLRTVADVQQITNPDLRLLGALPTLYDARTTHTRDVLLDVADRYGLPVLAPPIPRTVRFAEASASGASVIAGRRNKGAVAYRQFADALLKHWKTGKALPTFAPEV